jgi:anti-sigma B factor antagonist
MTQDALAPLLKITVDPQAPWIVVRLSGELSHGSHAGLDDQLSVLVTPEHPRICVDLGRLTFCDSSGVVCLLRWTYAARDHAGTLVLSRPVTVVARMFALLGLTSVLTVLDELPV